YTRHLSLLPCAFLHSFASYHTPTSQTHTLSLHDALPISSKNSNRGTYLPNITRQTVIGPESTRPIGPHKNARRRRRSACPLRRPDRKSTRLNSSHGSISYAVFCLKKKK